MAAKSYKKAYEDARAEMVDLANQRAALDRRIARLRKFLIALEPMVHEEGTMATAFAAEGLRDSCLHVLRAAYKDLTPSEVVRELRNLGFDIDKYSNPVAVVTTTLKRLWEVDNVVEIETLADGKRSYTIMPEFAKVLAGMRAEKTIDSHMVSSTSKKRGALSEGSPKARR